LASRCAIAKVDPDNPNYEMLLTVNNQALEIRWTPKDDVPVERPISIDLLHLDTTSGHGRSKKQPIAKAIGLANRPRSSSPMTVVDATAGLGEDAWLLASLGCRIIAIERNPIIAALLQDALNRAAAKEPQIAQRIELICADARIWLESKKRPTESPPPLPPIFDAVYLDPMYPAKKKSARPRKEAAMLRRLIGHDDDADQLLVAALSVGRRIAVKRPLHAPTLGQDSGPKPVTVHKGKMVRYDIYAS
jgi:16S rRNA (guanine1516-N2)-methyltransferase